MSHINNKIFKTVKEAESSAYGPSQYTDCSFYNLDLSGKDFDDYVFIRCDFRRSRITQAKRAEFISCKLDHANFSSADLTHTKFMNCSATRLDLTGAIIPLDCYFLAGLESNSESDTWRLLFWATLLKTPASEKVHQFLKEQMPAELYEILKESFDRDPRY